MYKVIDVLVARDDMSVPEAELIIEDMRDRITAGEDPIDVLYELDLEPDYLFDLIGIPSED